VVCISNVRGVILNEARKQQIIDFSGLRYGNITPTDIDGAIEYKNKAYIFLEYKYGNTELPYGQRLAIKRLVQDADAAGKASIAIVASHDVSDTKQHIRADICAVREICCKHGEFGYEWREPKFPCTVKAMIDSFLSLVDKSA